VRAPKSIGPAARVLHGRSITVFVALPSGDPGRRGPEEMAVRRAIAEVASRHGVRIDVRTGADAETDEPRAIRHWCRRQILCTVDGLVAFAGPSWGASTWEQGMVIPRREAQYELARANAQRPPSLTLSVRIGPVDHDAEAEVLVRSDGIVAMVHLPDR
jgi:hypothetical protein